MAGKRRGVGYCTNPECGSHLQLFTLLDLPSTFDCPVCMQRGKLERERATHRVGVTTFDEVRVDYDFDPELGIYRESVRVRDARLLGSRDVYRLQSPLVRTREHAERVGKLALARLNQRVAASRPTPLPTRADLIAQGWPVIV